MFSKKKAAPVLPRSRFTKAKPNLKVLPKNSQQKEKEKKHEESSLNPKECEAPEIITPTISDETFNNSDSEKCSPLNQTESKVSEIVTPEVFDKTIDSYEYKKCASLNKNESKVSEIVTPEVSHKIVDSNEFKKCATEDKNATGVEKCDGSLEKVTSKENSLHGSALQSVNKNSLNSELVGSSEKISHNDISSSVSSPVKAVCEKSIRNNLLLEHFNEVTESPEKLINCSPTKTSVVHSIDKSNRYPCITKLLSAPKKRSKNIEIRERKKMMANYKDLPPRSEMTFTDLIFWNPHTSPMKSKESKTSLVFNPIEKETNPVEEDMGEEDEEDSVAPKLFVNEDGEIILDESSLVVKRKKTSVDMTSEAIIMDDSNITYSSFRRRVSKAWSPKETVKFYKALSIVGTDFALMENLMPNRTRRELKIKFKKEEKINMELLQRAMYETETFQSDLNVDDLNLDEIDIPGLEERIAEDLTGPNGKKQGKRKKNTEGSFDSDNVPKRPRGRPKKIKEGTDIALSSSDFGGLHFTNTASLIINRGRPKKTIDTSSIDSPNTENELCEVTETTLTELDVSPLIRKRKVKVLSQDSLESHENTTDDLVEIEVQIESSKSNKSHDQKNADTSTAVHDEKIFLEKDEATNGMLNDNVSKEQLALKTSTTSLTEHCYMEKRIESQKSNNFKSEQPCTNRKSKKVKINPNINTQKNKSVATKETLDIFQNGSILFPTSPSSIIEVTDEKLLSDGITDVVTSAHTKVSKKSKLKSTIPPYRNEQSNFCNTLQRLQPSSKNYTPVDEVSTDDDTIKKEKLLFNNIPMLDAPVFLKNPNQRKYGYNETKEHLHKSKSILPLPSSPLVDNLLNLNSSLETSLNMSSKEPITISVTPEQNISENSNGLMFMTQSLEGNSLHFYVANNFTGGLALPPEISVPPTNIVIKSEEENFDI